jgi:hypothetical protein
MDEIDATQKLEVGQEVWFGPYTAAAERGVVVRITSSGVEVRALGGSSTAIPFDKCGKHYIEPDAHWIERQQRMNPSWKPGFRDSSGRIMAYGPGPEFGPWELFCD